MAKHSPRSVFIQLAAEYISLSCSNTARSTVLFISVALSHSHSHRYTGARAHIQTQQLSPSHLTCSVLIFLYTSHLSFCERVCMCEHERARVERECTLPCVRFFLFSYAVSLSPMFCCKPIKATFISLKFLLFLGG